MPIFLPQVSSKNHVNAGTKLRLGLFTVAVYSNDPHDSICAVQRDWRHDTLGFITKSMNNDLPNARSKPFYRDECQTTPWHI